MQNIITKLIASNQYSLGLLGLIILFVFSIGVTQSYLCSVPLTLMLANYDTSLMPYLYIGISVVSLFFVGLDSYFQKKISLLRFSIL